MFWWLIFLVLLFFVPFLRYAIIFLIIFTVISILLTLTQAMFGIGFRKKTSQTFRQKQKGKPSAPWSTPNDDIEDAQFREEKK